MTKDKTISLFSFSFLDGIECIETILYLKAITWTDYGAGTPNLA